MYSPVEAGSPCGNKRMSQIQATSVHPRSIAASVFQVLSVAQCNLQDTLIVYYLREKFVRFLDFHGIELRIVFMKDA